jgi:ABC-type sugar transport system ATPase subunit
MLPEKWLRRARHYGKQRVIGGIRPSAIRLSTQPEALRALVNFTELLLGETIVGLSVGEKSKITALLTDDSLVEDGAHIAIEVDAEQLILFDPDTTQALA